MPPDGRPDSFVVRSRPSELQREQPGPNFGDDLAEESDGVVQGAAAVFEGGHAQMLQSREGLMQEEIESGEPCSD